MNENIIVKLITIYMCFFVCVFAISCKTKYPYQKLVEDRCFINNGLFGSSTIEFFDNFQTESNDNGEIITSTVKWLSPTKFELTISEIMNTKMSLLQIGDVMICEITKSEGEILYVTSVYKQISFNYDLRPCK